MRSGIQTQGTHGRALAIVLTLLCAALLPRLGPAQDLPPERLPRILFLVEDSDAMLESWKGGGGYAGSRWSYVKDALMQLLATAPPELEFAIVMSPNGRAQEVDGFERVIPFGWTREQAMEALALQDFSQMGGPTPRLAEGYANVIENWFAITGGGAGHGGASGSSGVNDTAWLQSPFICGSDEVVVLVIGTGSDIQQSGAVSRGALTGTPPGGYYCEFTGLSLGPGGSGSGTGYDDCLLDNVAHYAHHSFVSPLFATGVVRTHTLLLDPTSSDIHAEDLYRATAVVGAPEAHFAWTDHPSGLFGTIQASVNAAISGEYGGGGVTVSPRGDRMFSTFFDLDGHPLAEGHLLGFKLDTAPESPRFGDVIPGPGPQGAQWDAGELLARRSVVSGERNQTGFSPIGARNGFIAGGSAGMYSAFEPFDSSGVQSGDLVSLLVDPVSISGNPRCLPLPDDYDFDCDVDADDAQHLVDFVRGVPTVTFRGSAIQRGVRRLGDAGLSRPVYAPSSSATVGTDRAFAEYQAKLRRKPSMVYLASNAGMLHAFEANSGNEFWFVVPRAKARWDAAAAKDYDGHRLQDLAASGRRTLNSGQINLQHVWLDGYVTDLPGCPGPAVDYAARDGKMDPDGCEWHRVLLWSGGHGARHSYAVDVTNPENPRFLWERTDETTEGEGQGRAVGITSVASFVDRGAVPEMRWVTVRTAGPQGPEASTDGPEEKWAHAALYIDDLEESALVPTDYPDRGFQVPVPHEGNHDGDIFDEYDPADTEGLYGTPALADIDGDGSVDVGYFGDSLGNVYKLLFQPEKPLEPKICVFSEPVTGDTAGAYHAPAIFWDRDHGLNVWWATGSPYDLADPTASGGLYARLDPDPHGCRRSVNAPCVGAGSIFDAGGYLGFSGAGEKSAGALTVRSGRLFLATYVRGDSECALGNGRLYGVDTESCSAGLYDDPGDAYDVRAGLYVDMPGLISEPTFANDRLYTLASQESGEAEVEQIKVRPPGRAPSYFVARRDY